MKKKLKIAKQQWVILLNPFCATDFKIKGPFTSLQAATKWADKNCNINGPKLFATIDKVGNKL